jgi:hypothetical protein
VSEPSRPTFSVAVVGSLPPCDSQPEEARAAERLAVFLDRVTARAREAHNLCLVTFTRGIGAPWAQKRGHSMILIPRFDGHGVADREMVEFASAVVVVGDRARWARLIRLATEAGKPVRFYNG